MKRILAVLGLLVVIALADLHADTLLWKRDLSKQSSIGHIDMPRLRSGSRKYGMPLLRYF
ncbi:MAG: hypothetical protein WBM61_16950 [Woeseiaceae bacterium]|jgi:hypothetical protein